MANNREKTILVTGATGHQGGAVFRNLREKGFSLRALTRHPDGEAARRLVGPGVEVVRGDFDDPDSLRAAMQDVFGVYSVQNPRQSGGAEKETEHGKALIDLANRADVSHFVYSSVEGVDEDSGVSFFESKRRIEDHLRASGLSYTILRPSGFMENWLDMREQLERDGKIALPLRPDTPMQLIAVDDIGAFAGMAFEKPGAWKGKTVPLAGDMLTMAEIAQALSRAMGRDIRYEQVPWDAFEQQVGPELTRMYRFMDTMVPTIDIAALRRQHPQLMNFERWLHTKWPAGAGTAAGR